MNQLFENDQEYIYLENECKRIKEKYKISDSDINNIDINTNNESDDKYKKYLLYFALTFLIIWGFLVAYVIYRFYN